MSAYALGVVLDGEFQNLPILKSLTIQSVPLANHKSVDVCVGVIYDVKVAFAFRTANEFCEDVLTALHFLGCERVLTVYEITFLYNLD